MLWQVQLGDNSAASAHSWLSLEFKEQNADLGLSDIFHRVRRQWRGPMGDVILSRSAFLSCVKKDVPILVATDEMGPTHDVSDAAPAVRVQRHNHSRRNFRL
jgi:hypothetical protein